MSGRPRAPRALLALARVHRELSRRSSDFGSEADLEVALEVVELEVRAVAGATARGKSAEEIIRGVLALPPPPRKRTPVDAAVLAVLDRRTGFGGRDAEHGMTTEALAAEVRARGVEVVDETVRRRALALAREGELSATKLRFTVAQRPTEDLAARDLFGGAGRCLRRQWRFAVPSSRHPAGVRGGR